MKNLGVTQIKKRININSFFRGGWATGVGMLRQPRRAPLSASWPTRCLSQHPRLSRSPFSFSPSLPPLLPLLALLLGHFLFSPFGSVDSPYLSLALLLEFHLLHPTFLRANDERLRKNTELPTSNDDQQDSRARAPAELDLRDAPNASTALVIRRRASEVEGWPSKRRAVLRCIDLVA